MKPTKQTLCNALRAFIAQRSGLDPRNYGDRESLMGDYRPILKEGRHARTLLRAVELRDGISAADLVEASKRAFSGRLTFKVGSDGSAAVDYCTGQYFPTEYRAAACAVLASALWSYFRANMPKGELALNSETGDTFERYEGLRAGDWIRRQARREFGPAIARDWFN